ncbi:MAG: DEAD/DEAH box helicase [Solirubrobacterales bacterium]
MTSPHDHWILNFAHDVHFGYVGDEVNGPRQFNPRLVLNQDGSTVEHTLVEELARSDSFTFSVAFISPGAIAQLKQHLLDFDGTGRIITSDFLGFNQPEAFAELMKLSEHTGVDVRRHTASAFHPKGYIFDQDQCMTAVIGSSNLTSSALSRNHEWNLRVSAATGSDLADQFHSLLREEVEASKPLTEEWIDQYAATYVAAPGRGISQPLPDPDESGAACEIVPNAMQQDALHAIDFARAEGAERAIIVSATGTGKTMLSALDVRAVNPERMLFIAHREQILDRTIDEYRLALGGPASDFGKLTGNRKQSSSRFVFATIQTLAQPKVLAQISPDAFDYVIVDEAHRAGAETYRRAIDHLSPAFLLGMTATPERTDGFNVFELFNYVVPYEIRLNHALEAEMLAPFHYYGITDVTFEDGTTTTAETELQLLITPQRLDHLLVALDKYGQAGVAPKGLIFCSRKAEAHALSAALNERVLRGHRLRTVALTGEDPVAVREQRVAELEDGTLDYILTVDVFNEGVDIPAVNQVVMLRQTQSPIVFVQQLGRGLRLAKDKDHLVVIDVIGNYAKNFLIPIALFGDESLNRESLRERMNETVDGGTLPGLSSVSFDEIARERILASIAENRLDSMANLRNALVAMRNRTGDIPTLWDFYRFESVNPVLLATRKEHYPALVKSLLREDNALTDRGSRALMLLSNEALAAKRVHECLLLEQLLGDAPVSVATISESFARRGLEATELEVRTAIDSLVLRGYSQVDETKYESGIAEQVEDVVRLTHSFHEELTTSQDLSEAVADLLKTGLELNAKQYLSDRPFTPGMQYSRRDASRIVGWPRSVSSTVYGYKTDAALGVCAIFVTLHKAEDVDASTAYEDALLDRSSMRWFSKNNRNLRSRDVQPIVDGTVALHVFVQKDDSDGSDHYYLGAATAHDALETTMPGASGQNLPVVTMTLKFDAPISQGLFDYFGPTAR